MQRPSQNRRRGITALEVVITILILLMLTALFFPRVHVHHQAARRSTCKNNLKQIGLALHNYHEQANTFPPGWCGVGDNTPADHFVTGATSAYGWAVPILGNFDKASLGRKMNFKGLHQAGANDKEVQSILASFRCPSDVGDSQIPNNTGRIQGTSNYPDSFGVGIPENVTVMDSRRCQGIFGPNTRVRIRDIKDGTTNVIAVGERRLTRVSDQTSPPTSAALTAHGVVTVNGVGYSIPTYWSGTDGLTNQWTPAELVATTTLGSPWTAPTGANLDLASYPLLRINKTGPNHAAAGRTPNGVAIENNHPLAGDFIDLNTIGFSSWHIGGAQFLLCDGSVKFISENVDPQTLVNISRRADGQTVGAF